MRSLGVKIRELRIKKGLTQIELSKDIVTPSMCSQIESDRARPSYKVLAKLAERLEVPLDKLLVDVDMNLEFVSTFKMARAMVAAGEYATAIPLLKQVLETQRSIISEMEILLELADCYLHTGELAEAKTQLEKLQDQAVFRHDTYTLAKTFKSLGQVEYECKQYQLAAHYWKKALEEVEKMEQADTFLKASILRSLGDGHAQFGMVNEAIRYYNQASALYENSGNLNEIANIYLGLGQSYKRLQDFERAADYSERALAIYSGLENMYMNVKVKVSTAIVYGQTGRESEAMQMLEQSIRKLQELKKSDDVGMAYVELAKVQLSNGQIDEAEESCRIARSLLPELHKYQAWGNRVIGDIELKRCQPDGAIRRFQMAADCFKSVGELGEWANTMADISRLKFEENDIKGAYRIIDEVRNQTQQALQERGIVL